MERQSDRETEGRERQGVRGMKGDSLWEMIRVARVMRERR